MSPMGALFPKTIYAGHKAIKTSVITTPTQLNLALKDLLSTINAGNVDIYKPVKRVVSIDVEEEYRHETSPHGESLRIERTSMIKLCYDTTCLIIDVMHMDAPTSSLSKFLHLPQLTFVGKGISHSLAALDRNYGIKCRNAVDLGELAAKLYNKEVFRCFGLLDLAKSVGSIDSSTVIIADTLESLDVTESLDLWHCSTKQVEIATLYAWLSFHVGNDLLGVGR